MLTACRPGCRRPPALVIPGSLDSVIWTPESIFDLASTRARKCDIRLWVRHISGHLRGNGVCFCSAPGELSRRKPRQARDRTRRVRSGTLIASFSLTRPRWSRARVSQHPSGRVDARRNTRTLVHDVRPVRPPVGHTRVCWSAALGAARQGRPPESWDESEQRAGRLLANDQDQCICAQTGPRRHSRPRRP
jgi:hypothetical protein